MNVKTFIYMILTFRRVDPIPKKYRNHVKCNILDIRNMDNIKFYYTDS